ncbi:MAG: DNA primase [Deltaproteobacteria bacterium]|nr:DNA primase [Deltaproteobacteria bacterium]
MDFIPEEKITEIKGKASIVEIISDFVSLKKSGKNHLGLCPFHAERTPSFTINEEKGIFHCFGCGAGGNLFNFLMRANNLNFPEAVKEVARRYGIALPQRELSVEEKRRRSLRGQLLEMNEAAADFYHRVLRSQKEGEEGRRYLAKRGIAEEIIEAHRLGFAPDAWDALANHMHNKGLPLKTAETLGLLLPRKEGLPGRPSFYDRFRCRVIFPIMNEGGQVCGFGGRITDASNVAGGQSPPKYLNSPESPVYSKGQMLYGLNVAKGPIREKGVAFLVEGYMDLLSLHQQGIRNVVASLGTALTSAQANLLGRFTREVVLIFDADEGGQKATQRSLELFLQERMAVKVASLPTGADPDSFIRKEGKTGFAKVLGEALPVMEFLLQQAIRRHGTATIEGKVRIVRELLPALNRLSDALEQNLYIERISSVLPLKESQIRSQIKGIREPAERPANPPPKNAQEPPHERLLLQLMLTHPEYIPVVIAGMGSERFSSARGQGLASALHSLRENGDGPGNAQALLDRLRDEELKGLTAELLVTEESLIEPERTLKDCLRKVKLSRVYREIQRVDEEIRERSHRMPGGSSGPVGLKELLKRKQRLILEQKKWVDDSALGPRPNAA